MIKLKAIELLQLEDTLRLHQGNFMWKLVYKKHPEHIQDIYHAKVPL